MISAGVEGRIPYMTYSESWRGPPKQQQELFLVPAPKPLSTSRYNGVNTTSPNGTRLVPPLVPPSRPISKYPSPPTIPMSPVNLAQTKEEANDDLSQFNPYQRVFPGPYFQYPIYSQHHPYMLSRNYAMPPTPLSPMDTFSPTIPTPSSTSTFLSPPSTFSPPSSVKTMLRDKRTPPQTPTSIQPQGQTLFKMPSGKEGSMKHRILTRPEDNVRNGPLDLQKPTEGRKRLAATISPPRSPKKTINNNTIPGSFTKGSLIRLDNGELRRVEDMRTEDFIASADSNPELRLAESTVVKIENRAAGTATITLSYNQRRAQVEVESQVEHPYFVMGRGWASCHPERTQQCYGLSVHPLNVGDILISLTPRETPPSIKSGTIMTTATTTAITSRPVNSTPPKGVDQMHQPVNMHAHAQPSSASPDRKRRWSAPDDMCEEEQNARRPRAE